MEDQEFVALKAKITELELEHRDLDASVESLGENTYVDQIQQRRMKRRKLMLKDEITRLKSALIPDMDA